MADGPTPAQWAELRTRRPASDDALTTISITTDGVETPLSMAMDVAGNLHLLIPVQRGPTDPKPPDLNGLKIRHRRLESGEFLDLVASPSHEQIFNPVCKDILDAILVEQRDP